MATASPAKTKHLKIDIDSVIVQERTRKHFSNMEKLIDSMAMIGQLQPIVINSKNELIAGERRLRAAKELGWSKIDATYVESMDDLDMALVGEYDENVCREPFTPSESYRHAERVRDIVSKFAEERRLSKLKSHKPEEKPEVEGEDAEGGIEESSVNREGKTEEILADIAGTSYGTYQKIKQICEAAQADPKFAPLVEKMDSTGNVTAAYRELKKAQEPPKPSSTADGGKKIVHDANGAVVPKKLHDAFEDANTRKAIEDLDQAIKLVKEARKLASSISQWNPYLHAQKAPGSKDPGVKEISGKLIKELSVLLSMFQSSMPNVVCRHCSGKGCSRCRKSGFIVAATEISEAASEASEGSEE
ncbi:MAG: ParB N-terminal domain-containing protein [Candidatus Competibacteraceae bacterium]|nr:ParB N-terminal domain-containing protein [Candidatus Competibacteraceae bacterium]